MRCSVTCVTSLPSGESLASMVPTQRPLVADADLLQRVVQRDATALIELERRHRPSLYAQAYGMLMDSTLAEGVVREVFAPLSLVADRLGVRRSPWSWLRMLAKDLARGRAGAPRCAIRTTVDPAEDQSSAQYDSSRHCSS